MTPDGNDNYLFSKTCRRPFVQHHKRLLKQCNNSLEWPSLEHLERPKSCFMLDLEWQMAVDYHHEHPSWGATVAVDFGKRLNSHDGLHEKARAVKSMKDVRAIRSKLKWFQTIVLCCSDTKQLPTKLQDNKTLWCKGRNHENQHLHESATIDNPRDPVWDNKILRQLACKEDKIGLIEVILALTYNERVQNR